jgi:hypothetical protein
VILVGLPCAFCGSPTMPHCKDATCKWSRCARCTSYGVPGKAFVQWFAHDYINPFNLLEIKVENPTRTMPEWLTTEYGKKHDCGN